MSTTTVAFDGWSLIGASPEGGVWKVLDVDGWLAKTLRRNRQPRAGQSGNWPSAGNIDGKTVTIKGQAIYPTAAGAARERRLVMALGGRDLSELTIEDAAGQLTAFVETDAIDVKPVRDTMLTFTITVHAPDATLYGPQAFAQAPFASTSAGAGLTYPLTYPLDYGVPAGVTPGSVTVANDGTTAYWPRVRIDGPVTNPAVSLVETGDTIRYRGTVPAGQHLDLDCPNRRATIGDNPASVRRWVSAVGNWLAVPPGGASIAATADSAGPAASFSVWSYEGACS
ncbi:hypothetical protein GCM10009740_31380 [Terrabacter terrae]|uniref:Siphovirus-type tail component C-terminal domain-containing protein n=1 Tax=Terrabacter terrae TaxID=318434 RepID=A0ABN2UJ48_9MICO